MNKVIDKTKLKFVINKYLDVAKLNLAPIRAETKRIFTSITLYIGLLLMVISGWTQYIEMNNGTLETAFSVLLTGNTNVSFYPDLSFPMLILGYSSGWWFTIVASVAVSLICALYYCDERVYGMTRFSIFRISKARYICTKLICSTLSSIIIVIIGFFIFVITLLIASHSLLPVYNDDIRNEIFALMTAGGSETVSDSLTILIIKNCLSMLGNAIINTTFWSMVSLALASIKPNKYFVIISPVVIYYFWDKLMLGHFFDERFLKWFSILNPDMCFPNIVASWYEITGMRVLSVLLALTVIVVRFAIPVLLFSLSEHKKLDCGGFE